MHSIELSSGLNKLPELQARWNRWKTDAIHTPLLDIHPFEGMENLRSAIAQRYSDRYNTKFDYTNISITNGSSNALYIIFSWMKEQQIELIIQAPAWSHFEDLANFFQLKYHFSFAKNAPSLKKNLQKLNTNSKKLFFLTNPSNPEGFVFPPDYLHTLSNWVIAQEEHYVLSDEIYDLFPAQGITSWLTVHGLQRSILINGYSKPFGLGSVRTGYYIADQPIRSRLNKYQKMILYTPNNFGQQVSLMAQKEEKELIPILNKALEERKSLVKSLWKQPHNLHIMDGMYALLDLSLPEKKQYQFIKNLKTQYQVEVTSCYPFRRKGGLRINLTRPKSDLEIGLNRIQECLQNYNS